MSYPTISHRPSVQAAYEAMRAEGTSHSLAEMFALGSPPMSNTDREFLEGTGSQFSESPLQSKMGDFYKSVAERHGQNVKGKTYVPGLARFPGDPRAWVTGRGDVQKVCEDRGWNCEGSVRVNAIRDDTPPERIDVADDIVKDVMQRRKRVDPDLAHKDQRDVYEETKEMLLPKES